MYHSFFYSSPKLINKDDIQIPFSSLDDLLQKENFQLPPEYLDINEENVNLIYKEICESGTLEKGIIRSIEFSLKIRPKQKDSICNLLKKIYANRKIKPKSPLNFNSNKNSDFNLSVQQSIKEDNVAEFIKLSSNPLFNFQEKCYNNDGYFNAASHMQLMALYGSIKCFKYALLDGSFNEKELAKFAIAGGNREIINLLEKKDVSFDYCFRVSVKFHRHDISNWMLNNYQCDLFDITECVNSFNYRALLFFLINNISDVKLSADSLLLFITKTGDLSFLKYFIKNFHPNIEATRNNKTAYFIAKENGFDEIMKYLSDECHAITVQLDDGALYRACKIGDFEMVKKLVEEYNFNPNKGYAVDYRKELVNRPLHIACKNGYINIVKYLVNKGAKLNMFGYDNDGTQQVRVPLYFAIEGGHLNIVKYIMEKDFDFKNRFSRSYGGRSTITPLSFAKKCKNKKIIKYIESRE